MRWTRYIWLLAILGLWFTAQPDMEAATKKKAKTTATKKTTTKSKSKTKSTARSSKTRSRAKTYRATQQKPAPERYLQIQQALAGKGFAASEPDGTWNDSWVASLKKFQSNQNLKPDGKLNSLSLIALGLGPQRSPTPAKSTPNLTEP